VADEQTQAQGYDRAATGAQRTAPTTT
jgi:hypothetical protein